MSIRAGTNAAFACVGVVLMFTLAGETGSIWLQVAGCGLVGLLAASAIAVVTDNGCVVEMEHGTDFVVGRPAEITFRIHNTQQRPSRAMVVRYLLESPRPLLPLVTVYVDAVEPGGRVEVRAPVVPLARGESSTGKWSVERFGAFGFFSARPTRTTNKHVAVAPAPAPPIDLGAAGGSADGGDPIRPGLEVRGAREWRPGDPARHVHWRSTARTGRLTVLERGAASRNKLGVVIVGHPGAPTFEWCLAVAASTVGCAIEDGAECFAWLEQAGAGWFGPLTHDSFLTPFTRAEHAGFPSPQGLSYLLEQIGPGGTMLVAAAADVPLAWRQEVSGAAAAADVVLVDVLAFTDLGVDRA